MRQLVNNLNKDNEILNGDIDDLRTGFLFLHEKHKELLRKYQRECLNRQVVETQRSRIEDLTKDNDLLGATNI